MDLKNRASGWTPFALCLLGIWLLFAPAGFQTLQTSIVRSDLLCGILLIFLSRFTQKAWGPWAVSAVGVWLQFAPLLFWAKEASSYLNNTFVGVLAITFSLLIPKNPGSLPDEGPSVPPNWSYNPSSWAQRLPIALFAFLCWMLSRYLAAYQLGYIDTVWDPFFPDGTLRVITSKISKSFPISDAGLGALAYTLEFLSSCKGGERRWRTMPWMVLVFGILVIPVGLVSTILIILQPLVVGAWCTACLITALFMLVLIALSLDEVAATFQYLRYSKEKPFWALLFQGGHCPSATEDQRTPSLQGPWHRLWAASLWGVGMPWNLAVAALVGGWIMFNSSFFDEAKWVADLDHILGALTIVASLIACSEVARGVRWILLIFASGILALGFFSLASLWIHIGVGLALALLSSRKGKIRERVSYKRGF